MEFDHRTLYFTCIFSEFRSYLLQNATVLLELRVVKNLVPLALVLFNFQVLIYILPNLIVRKSFLLSTHTKPFLIQHNEEKF